MKRKEIEMIPFLGLPRVKRGKKVEHVAVTDVKEVGKEPCLLVEVYRNRRDAREAPVVRIALTQKDFGSYFPEAGTWSREKVARAGWSGLEPIWSGEDGTIRKSDRLMMEENVLQSPEDMERIKGFLEDVHVWGKDPAWWEYINKKQEDIIWKKKQARKERELERRMDALEERERGTGKLPEERILRYAEDVLFNREHRLYYRKHGARATVACSNCGGVTDRRWRPGESYESQLRPRMDEPRQGAYGTCPMCGAAGRYMPQGKAGIRQGKEAYLFLGQRYGESGMVLRYVRVEKEWTLEQGCEEKGPEMCGSGEKLCGMEVARAYFEPGKKVQVDYHKHDPYRGEDFWDDCNLNGWAKIGIGEARIMPETYREMEGTFLRYSAMEGYQRAAGGEINPIDYLERYVQIPQMEMLVKMGLVEVVRHLVRCRPGIVADMDAKRLDAFLGIRKERVRQLIRHKGDMHILEAMKMEKRMGQSWTDEQVEHLAELRTDGIGEAMSCMGIQKFLNAVARYAGCGYGTMCSRASGGLGEAARMYLDYLGMRRKLGYDMANSVYLFPKSLREAHAKMVEESSKEEYDRRIQEVSERYQMIRKSYRRLRRKFYYEDQEFLIRPAKDAGEIVKEGRILHHCVGGDTYLARHDSGRSTILFLRYREEPDIPYITVEIGTDSLRIAQWYGAHDRKPDEDRMQGWLDAYVARLRSAGQAAGVDAGEEGCQQMLMAAV